MKWKDAIAICQKSAESISNAVVFVSAEDTGYMSNKLSFNKLAINIMKMQCLRKMAMVLLLSYYMDSMNWAQSKHYAVIPKISYGRKEKSVMPQSEFETHHKCISEAYNCLGSILKSGTKHNELQQEIVNDWLAIRKTAGEDVDDKEIQRFADAMAKFALQN